MQVLVGFKYLGVDADAVGSRKMDITQVMSLTIHGLSTFRQMHGKALRLLKSR